MTSFTEDRLGPTSPAHRPHIELAMKYACQGPPYTTYPTALQFNQDFPRDLYNNLQHSDDKCNSAPLSLYVHLPFCEDASLYGARHNNVNPDENAGRAYMRRLQSEIDMQSRLVGKNRPITQMHWGGGTPTFLESAEITELMHMLACHFRLLDKGYREYSIEIDPRDIELDTIALLKGLGFNRIRLSILDFDPLVQKSINRAQPFSQIKSLVDCIREHSFRSLTFDLIYGLPHQDQYSMEETLRKVIALGPDRIACYNYVAPPSRCNSQHTAEERNIPSAHENLLLQHVISQGLQAAGYLHIGMDHYALPQDELVQAQREGRLQRNFQGYSVLLAEDSLGLGVAAMSQIGDFYLQNERELGAYYARIDQGEHPSSRGFRIKHEDKLRRHIIMSLICELRLDIPECSRRFGINFSSTFHQELRQMAAMEADGLLHINEQEIQVSQRGRHFLRNICMLFDAYLPLAGDEPPPRLYDTGW